MTIFAYSLNSSGFNMHCRLPYQLTTDYVRQAMQDWLTFWQLINQQLQAHALPYLEHWLMPATISGIVGEFISTRLPLYCSQLVKNRYPNGHPDLIPKGMFPEDAIQYAREGIEIKASRHASGWQGHNPETVWLMVFQISTHTAYQRDHTIHYTPFRFKAVYAALLEQSDWSFSGRSSTSRRTITATINRQGMAKLREHWVYRE